MIKKKYFYITIACILLISSVYMAWAAVSGESLLNIQNSTSSGSLLSPVRVKDAGNISDNQTSGILPSGLMGYDGTNWDKVRINNGSLFVNMSSNLGTSTVKANQGTANTNTNGWPVKITDGTNVLGTSTNPLRTDPTGTTSQLVRQTNYTSLNSRTYQGGTWTNNVKQSNYTTLNGRMYQGGTWTVVSTTPTSSFSTIFNSNTSGFGAFKNLSGFYSKHAWQVSSTKHTPDVSWTIKWHQSLDGVNSESGDTFTTRTSFSIRNIANKPTSYIRAEVQRSYTGIRPTIVVKSRSGGN